MGADRHIFLSVAQPKAMRNKAQIFWRLQDLIEFRFFPHTWKKNDVFLHENKMMVLFWSRGLHSRTGTRDQVTVVPVILQTLCCCLFSRWHAGKHSWYFLTRQLLNTFVTLFTLLPTFSSLTREIFWAGEPEVYPVFKIYSTWGFTQG